MAAKNVRLYRWLITKHTIYDNNHTEDEKETELIWIKDSILLVLN